MTRKTRAKSRQAEGQADGDKAGSSTKDVQHCVSCSKVANDSAVGCDICERWVCNTEMCSGLPKQLLDAINAYDGGGISFICIKCRIERQNTPSKAQPQMMELISQLFQQMQGICNTLQGLVEKVNLLSSQPKTQTQPLPASSHPKPVQTPVMPMEQYREMVKDEVKEMQEREKRRHSVIVKGLKAKTTEECATNFKRMTEEVMGVGITLSDIIPIPNHPHLFRGKILNVEHRNLALDKAKNLKGSGYSTVFISRDLTYAQRTELFNRRKARRAEQGGATSTAPAQAHDPVRTKESEASTTPSGSGTAPPPTLGN